MLKSLQALMPLLRDSSFCYPPALTGHGMSLQGLIPSYNVPMRYQSAFIQLFTSAEIIGRALKISLAVLGLSLTISDRVVILYTQR